MTTKLERYKTRIFGREWTADSPDHGLKTERCGTLFA
jgi:hypothetical protein